MRNIVIIIMLLLCISAPAQSDFIINTVTLCIAEGRYNDAERFLDSFIRVEPKNIDALMMKGNVLLNYALMQTPAQNIITPEDEYIYSQDLASLKAPIVLVPREQALKIEKLWKQCLDIDTGRLDIREGLCTVYSMADMKKELLDYLPVAAKAGKAKGDDFVYALMQYAQLLAERGDKEGSYEVYKKIASLYPDRRSVWCQLATAYQVNGDLTNARLYADKAFDGTPPVVADMAGCGAALDVYSAQGAYARELIAMNVVSLDTSFHGYTFYRAIYKYAHNDTTWREKMTEFLKEYHTVPDSDILYTATLYMLDAGFKSDYHDFKQLLSFANSDFYTGLIIEKAMQDYKDSLQPYMEAAKLMVDGYNYTKANSIYASLETRKMDGDLRTVYQLEYGYSLYCAHEYAKAIAKFNKITDPAFAVIVDYFLGQCHLRAGNKNLAMTYFKKVSDSKEQTKYSYLAGLQMEKLAKK